MHIYTHMFVLLSYHAVMHGKSDMQIRFYWLISYLIRITSSQPCKRKALLVNLPCSERFTSLYAMQKQIFTY